MQRAFYCRWCTIVSLQFLILALPQAHSRSITLEESLQYALVHNETLQMAREDLGKSQQQIRQAAADAFPQLNATFSYTRNWLLPSLIFDTSQGQEQITVGAPNNLTSTIGISQSLFSGGKTFAALRIARLFTQFSEETLRSTRQQVHTEVETAFYDLLLAQELERVSRSSVNRARANQSRVEKLHRAGRVSNYDLLRAKVQVAELQTDSIRAQNSLALSTLTFKNLTGLDPDLPIEPQGIFRKTSTLPLGNGENALIALSMRLRPAVRQHQLEVQMRQKAEIVMQSESRPTLDLLVNGQWQAQRDDFGFKASDFRQSWFSGLTLRIPVFDGSRTRTQVAQARSDTRRAKLALKQTERAVRLNVMQSWRSLQEARARNGAQIQAVDLARQGMIIAESRYNSGVGTQLEIIDGQLTLQRAEAELARAQRDVAVALLYLELSTGMLGEPTHQ